MIRKFVFALGLAMLPAAAQAQVHQHPAADTARHQEHAMDMKQHEMFVQKLIDKRADLKLTTAQVTKLQAFKTKMTAHHAEMMKGDMKNMKHDPKMEDQMHSELLAIFTPAQRKQVDVMMKAQMAECTKSSEGMCKMDMNGMKDK